MPLKKVHPKDETTGSMKPCIERADAHNRLSWPVRHVRLLGRVSDQKVVEKTGYSLSAVCAERRRRGIPAWFARRERVAWTPEMIALLGTDSDGNVGDALGIARHAVAYKRRTVGIAPFSPPPQATNLFSWSRARQALLGTVPDRELADRLGCVESTVAIRRRALGIPPYRPPKIVSWSDEMLEALGRDSDLEIARRFGVSHPTVRKKRQELGIAPPRALGPVARTSELRELLRLPSSEVRRRTGLKYDTIKKLRDELDVEGVTNSEWRWSPEIVARMGKEPDRQIAEDVGRSASRVTVKRQSLGIAAFRAWCRWLPEETALLGTAPDAEVAVLIGRNRRSVAAKRAELGLPASNPADAP